MGNATNCIRRAACFLVMASVMLSAREFDFGKESGRRYASAYGKAVTLTPFAGGMSASFSDQAPKTFLRKGFCVRLKPPIFLNSFTGIRLELDNPEIFRAAGVYLIDTDSNFYSAEAKKTEGIMHFSPEEIKFRYNEKGKSGKTLNIRPFQTMIIYVEPLRVNQGKNYEFRLKKVIFEEPGGKVSALRTGWDDPDWSALKEVSLREPVWQQTAAPGDGGTSWYLRIHPSDDRILVQSCDMGGNYMTWNASKSYSSINDPDWTFPRIAYISAADFCLKAPEIGYIGTEGNGIFKTVDLGKHWRPVDTSSLEMKFNWKFPRIPVSALSVHPENPDNVWAGIGYPRRLEYRGGGNRRLPQGLIHSTDGGMTWTHLDRAFPKDEMALAILFFKGFPDLIVVGTDGGVYRSDDGGKNFQSISAGLPLPTYFGGFDGIVDPKTGKPVLAAALEAEYQEKDGKTSATGGVWLYDWDREKWREITGNLRIPIEKIVNLPDLKAGFAPNPFWIAGRKKLWRDFLADPENRVLYDTTVVDVGKNPGQFFKKWDAARKDRFVTRAMAPFKRSLKYFLPDFHTIKIDPRDPDTIYVSIFQAQLPYGLWKTANGGSNWHQICRGARGWQDPAWSEYVPKDGVPMNMRQSWTRRQPMNYGTEKVRMGFWDIRKFDLSKSNPDVLYLHSHRITYRSEDGGKTWTDASNKILDEKHARFSGLGNSNICVFGLQFHPKDPDKLLLYMADGGVEVSSDGGRSIFALEETMFGSNQWVEGAAFDPDDSDRIYVLFHCADWLVGGIRGYYFLESHDFGKSFLNLSNPENGPLKLPPRQTEFSNRMGNLMIDPASPKKARRMLASHAKINRQILFSPYYWSNFVTRESQGVLESTDGGKSWHPSNNGMGEFREVVDLYTPDNLKTVYAAVASHRKIPGAGGLFRSADGGRNWQRVPTPCDSITQVTSAKGTLYIAGGWLPTAGDIANHGGVWSSSDQGATWKKLFGAPLVNNLAVNPVNPDYIYCTVEDGRHGQLIPAIGIYRSANGGKSWNRINRGLAFPWGFMRLVWHPTRRNELWLATYGSGCYKLVEKMH